MSRLRCAGRSGGHHRPERRGEEHAAENLEPHHRADQRARATLRGRVASLLEVGTGFHPELTGRENIFLNGAILGMSRAEIQRKFDEIVAFAEVEKFLDTPVKRYSSGMYVRLAFAVAAHLEPEILIVDEVLAVGDARVSEEMPGQNAGCVSKAGARSFCQPQHDGRSAVMQTSNPIEQQPGRGQGLRRGNCPGIFASALSDDDVPVSDWPDRISSGEARFTNVQVFNQKNVRTNKISFGESVTFRTCRH